MPSGRRPSSTPRKRPKPAQSRPESRPGRRRRAASSKLARSWRRDTRPAAVRAAVSATKTIRWTRPLIEAVLEELYVDDHFEELLGRASGDLRPAHYPQAIAVALILRHSWHPDDLACMLKRLKLRVDHA